MVNVDVIFITYNQEKYVEQGIKSIMNQKVHNDVNVRIIIADDCSTDSTLSKIKELEVLSPFPFTYTGFSNNLGYHENYKRSFMLSTGDYVAILEGDDWWHSENHIQQHIEFLEKNKNISMSFNQIRYFYSDSNSFKPEKWIYPKSYRYISLKEQIINGNQIGNLSACVFRRKLLLTLPEAFYKLDYADWELGIWMAQYGDIAHLKESTSTYRVDFKGQWTRLTEQEKRDSMVVTLNNMDLITHRKYNKLFENGKYNILNNIEVKPYTSWKTRLKKILGLN